MSDGKGTQSCPEFPLLTEMPELLRSKPEHKQSGDEDVQPLNDCIFRDSFVFCVQERACEGDNQKGRTHYVKKPFPEVRRGWPSGYQIPHYQNRNRSD